MRHPKVTGLGLDHVGLSTGVSLASKGFRVSGGVTNGERVEQTNSDNSTSPEPPSISMLESSIQDGLVANEKLQAKPSDRYGNDNLAPQTLNAPLDLEERVDVSVIMPAYNEAQSIDAAVGRTLQALQGTADSYEVIVIDDGSTDGTYEKVQALASEDSHVRAVRNRRNMGKGLAVKHAAEFVRGDSVVVMDADMEIAPDHLQRYVHILNKYDLCIASKRHPNSVYSAPLMRKFLSLAFNTMVQFLTGIRVADSQTGLKAMRGTYFKRIMKVISVKRYAYDVEILTVARLMNLRIAELPVKIEQSSGFSKKAVMYMVIDLLGIAYRLRIKRWYQRNLAMIDPKYEPLLRL